MVCNQNKVADCGSGNKNQEEKDIFKTLITVCSILGTGALIILVVFTWNGVLSNRMDNFEAQKNKENLDVSYDASVETTREWIRNTSVVLHNLDTKLSELRKDSVRMLQQIKLSVLTNVSDLANQIQEEYLNMTERVTMLAEMLAQQEHIVNTSIDQLLNTATYKLEQSINDLNETVAEELNKLSTQNEQLRVQLSALNETVQQVNASLQGHKEETHSNISKVTENTLSSLKAHQAAINSQLARTNLTVDGLNSEVTRIKDKQRAQDRTLSLHGQAITNLQDAVTELSSSRSGSSTLLPTLSSILIVCIVVFVQY